MQGYYGSVQATSHPTAPAYVANDTLAVIRKHFLFAYRHRTRFICQSMDALKDSAVHMGAGRNLFYPFEVSGTHVVADSTVRLIS